MIRAVIAPRALTPSAVAQIRASIDADDVLIVQRPLVADILRAVAFEMGLHVREIAGAGRARTLSRARAAVSYIAARHAQRSAAEIGRALGQRDHSTALNSVRIGQRYMDRDPAFRMVVRRVSGQLAHGGVQ